MVTDLIHHLAPAAEFEATPAGQPYLPAAFAEDGFIHCTSEPAVLLEVANRFYRAELGDFVVLDIDPLRLTAPLRYEIPISAASDDSPLAGVSFPHIFGPLNREAIVSVRPALRGPDGIFLRV